MSRHLPGWIARIIDEGEAVAEGELNWRDDTLLVDRLHARNDRFALAARMHMRADDLQGDLLAEWGRLAVGVELANGEKDFHLRRAREWFEGRPHTAAR